MTGILLAKVKIFIRNPWNFILFTGMSIAFALLLGNASNEHSLTIPVHADNEQVRSTYADSLEKIETYQIKWLDESQLKQQIENGKAELGVMLRENRYEIMVGVDSANVEMVEHSIENLYMKERQRQELVNNYGESSEVVKEWDLINESPVFSIDEQPFRGNDAVIYDSNFHFLFGFSLFFVIYTIGYTVLPILIEKQEGVWDRIILSPVKKWEVYIGNLLNSFFQGYLQIIVILFVFRYWVGINFYGRFWEVLLAFLPYVLAIIALSIFLVSIVKTVQQFNAIMPIVSVSMAMIGGAYWPLEIVQSNILLALSKINPITYGMELLNGIVIYQYPLEELLYPISILLLMTVLFMGIGIHLMERRHV